MQRPDVDKYEAMAAKATVGPWVSPWEMWPDEPENPEYPDDAEPDDCYFAGPNGERICYLMWYDGYHLAVLRDDAALMAAARTAIPELCAWAKHLERKMEYHFDQSLTISGETRKQIDALKSLLRDWLAACPQTCGQCDDVRKRAEEAVR